MEDENLKAISVNQPWSWCAVHGYKDVENRDWKTHIRGKILIHAGKNFDHEGYEWIKRTFPAIPLPKKEDFFMGGVVGTVEITDCVEKSDSPWFQGKYGFTLKNGHPMQPRICKGALMFFTPDYNSRYKVKTK